MDTDIEQLLTELAGAIAQLPLRERVEVYFDLPEDLAAIMEEKHPAEHDELLTERARQNRERRVRRRQVRRERRKGSKMGPEGTKPE